jgi:hypothetical protein
VWRHHSVNNPPFAPGTAPTTSIHQRQVTSTQDCCKTAPKLPHGELSSPIPLSRLKPAEKKANTPFRSRSENHPPAPAVPPRRASPNSPRSTTYPPPKRARSKKHGASSRSPWTGRRTACCPLTTSSPR